MGSSWRQAAAAAAIPYCAAAAAFKITKIQGSVHIFWSLVVRQVSVTRKYPTPVRIWSALEYLTLSHLLQNQMPDNSIS